MFAKSSTSSSFFECGCCCAEGCLRGGYFSAPACHEAAVEDPVLSNHAS